MLHYQNFSLIPAWLKKGTISLLFSLSVLFSAAQEDTFPLEIQVIRETLPQLLNNNPNSLAAYLKDGGIYTTILEINKQLNFPKTQYDSLQTRLDYTSDSLENILREHKLIVLLADTLYSYRYDGYNGTTEYPHLAFNSEWWALEKQTLFEVFQKEYKIYGLKQPVDTEFIDLIHQQLINTSNDLPIDLSVLDTSYYRFVNKPEESGDLQEQYIIHGIRIYRPVFNQEKNKACYLFSSQTARGPYREFVFAEKAEGSWIFIESYGSHHIDGKQNSP